MGSQIIFFFLFSFYFQKPEMQFLFLKQTVLICKELGLRKKFMGQTQAICCSLPDPAHTLLLCSSDQEPLKGRAHMLLTLGLSLVYRYGLNENGPIYPTPPFTHLQGLAHAVPLA